MSPKKPAPSAAPTPMRSRSTRSSARNRQADELPEDETTIAIRARSPSRIQPSWPSSNLGDIPTLQSELTTESAPARASRASSPSKKKNTFILRTIDEYPIKVKQYKNKQDLPFDVHLVYKEILGLVKGLPVIPRRWKDSFADDLEDLPENIVETLLLSNEELPLGELKFEEADLKIVEQVQRMAIECEEDGDSEPAWNCDVHSPLLALAFRRSERTNCKNITTAKMSATAKIREGNRAIEKLVDFGVIIGEPIIAEQDVINRLRQFKATDVGINQSIYAPLLYRPLALSIETKASSSDDDEAHAQLCVWTASQFKMLRIYRWDQTSLEPLPTLPVISTYKGRFTLHFAIPQNNGLLFVKNVIDMGNITEKLNAWRVYLALRRLENWAVEVYAPWFRREILGKGGELGQEDGDSQSDNEL